MTEILMHYGVPLLGAAVSYLQEKRDQKDRSEQDFIEWLEAHRHHELKCLLEGNQSLSNAIAGVINQKTDLILGEIEVMSGQLNQILSRLSGFGAVSSELSTNYALSDQAITILTEFSQSDCDIISPCSAGGRDFIFLHYRGWDAPEPRFLTDDLLALQACGFIMISDYNSDGKPLYKITRSGDSYARFLISQNPNLRIDESVAKGGVRDGSEVRYQMRFKLADPRINFEFAYPEFKGALTRILAPYGQPQFTTRGVLIEVSLKGKELSEDAIAELDRTAKEASFAAKVLAFG